MKKDRFFWYFVFSFPIFVSIALTVLVLVIFLSPKKTEPNDQKLFEFGNPEFKQNYASHREWGKYESNAEGIKKTNSSLSVCCNLQVYCSSEFLKKIDGLNMYKLHISGNFNNISKTMNCLRDIDSTF
ncbi:hypothetical protein EBU71_04270 [bacterium]|nr:hypothetical protein [Candidatus Elulimicrobium humile]